MLPNLQSNKSNSKTRPASNVQPQQPSRPSALQSNKFGRHGSSLRNDRRSRLVTALSNNNSNPMSNERTESSNRTQRMTTFVDNVTQEMFQLQPANVRQYDPAWMTERLDEIMDLVPSSSISKKNQMNDTTKATKSNSPKQQQQSNPRKNRPTKIASPSMKKWAQTPSTPRRGIDMHKMTVESVPTSPPRTSANQQEEQEEEVFMATNASAELVATNSMSATEMVATTPFAAEVISLTTGDDVIRFFARHGDDCPVSWSNVVCNRV